ncbi:unnamed protein product, partial [Allacma fusca]
LARDEVILIKEEVIRVKDEAIRVKEDELTLLRAQLVDAQTRARNFETSSSGVVNYNYYAPSHPPTPWVGPHFQNPSHQPCARMTPFPRSTRPPHFNNNLPIGFQPRVGMFYIFCSPKPLEQYMQATDAVMAQLRSLFGHESKITLLRRSCRVYFDSLANAQEAFDKLPKTGTGQVLTSVMGVEISISQPAINNIIKPA